MSEIEQEREANDRGVRLDLTINVPTLMTIGSMLVAATLYINNRFSDLTGQAAQQEVRISTLEKRMDSQDSSIEAIRRDAGAQNKTLRDDMRADMRDLKASVDNILTKLSERR